MKDVDKLVLVGLTLVAIGGIGAAVYWKYRFDKCTLTGAAWMLQAIQKMEEQSKTIESLHETIIEYENGLR